MTLHLSKVEEALLKDKVTLNKINKINKEAKQLKQKTTRSPKLLYQDKLMDYFSRPKYTDFDNIEPLEELYDDEEGRQRMDDYYYADVKRINNVRYGNNEKDIVFDTDPPKFDYDAEPYTL